MIIDFRQQQLQRFDDLAHTIIENSEQYLQFDSVSDFYKAEWLLQFPSGTDWACTGLDDGAEQFYAVIRYQNRVLSINALEQVSVQLHILVDEH